MNLKNAKATDFSGLIRNLNDTEMHRIWVNEDGDVFCDIVPANHTIDQWMSTKSDLKFYMEVFLPNNGYVGPDAANDTLYITQYLDKLRAIWKEKRTGFIDY